MIRLLIHAVLVTAMLASGTSASRASPRIALSGFGTIGYAGHGENDFVYRTIRAGGGADTDGSFALDTRFGVQLDVEATHTFGGTAQVVAREGADGDPAAELEWGFVRWFPNSLMTVRAGRMALPAFAISDYRDVGYANTAVRPPEDLYSQVPFSRYDGADLSFNGEYGETLWGLQVGVGRTVETLPDLRIEGDDTYVVNLVLERGPARLRIGRTSSLISFRSDAIETLRASLVPVLAFLPTLSTIVDQLSGGAVRGDFDVVGLRLDFERVFVETELARRRIDAVGGNGDARSGSLLVGTRVGALTPYLFASAFENLTDTPEFALPPVPALAPLEAGLELLYEDRTQSTLGAGLRWDLAPNMALKVQLEQVSSESTGISLVREGEATGSGITPDDLLLYAVSLDFVF